MAEVQDSAAPLVKQSQSSEQNLPTHSITRADFNQHILPVSDPEYKRSGYRIRLCIAEEESITYKVIDIGQISRGGIHVKPFHCPLCDEVSKHPLDQKIHWIITPSHAIEHPDVKWYDHPTCIGWNARKRFSEIGLRPVHNVPPFRNFSFDKTQEETVNQPPGRDLEDCITRMTDSPPDSPRPPAPLRVRRPGGLEGGQITRARNYPVRPRGVRPASLMPPLRPYTKDDLRLGQDWNYTMEVFIKLLVDLDPKLGKPRAYKGLSALADVSGSKNNPILIEVTDEDSEEEETEKEKEQEQAEEKERGKDHDDDIDEDDGEDDDDDEDEDDDDGEEEESQEAKPVEAPSQ